MVHPIGKPEVKRKKTGQELLELAKECGGYYNATIIHKSSKKD